MLLTRGQAAAPWPEAWRAYKEQSCGALNLGYSCFLNAAVQALLPWRGWLLSRWSAWLTACRPPKRSALTCCGLCLLDVAGLSAMTTMTAWCTPWRTRRSVLFICWTPCVLPTPATVPAWRTRRGRRARVGTAGTSSTPSEAPTSRLPCGSWGSLSTAPRQASRSSSTSITPACRAAQRQS